MKSTVVNGKVDVFGSRNKDTLFGQGKKVKGHEEPWSGNLQINDEGKITEIT